ncbi:MAG: phosphotransferase enzyme family protein [Myxococcota bacterium]
MTSKSAAPEERKTPDDAEAMEALSAWRLSSPLLRPMVQGNINRSYLVEESTGHRSVLQWVSPIFEPSVCDDIDRVTAHLDRKGLVTPRLHRTLEGRCHASQPSGTWRLMTFIPGRTFTRCAEPWQAKEAGRALGRFHMALADFDGPFTSRRAGVHDWTAHLAGLEAALGAHPAHPHRSLVAPLADAILQEAGRCSEPVTTPERVVHGDPKIANLVFAADAPVAQAWIDLDTVAFMRLSLEMGDALRSWCQAEVEDGPEAAAHFDLVRFEAACRGYRASGMQPEPVEWASFARATRLISLELAARFCRDAFETRYFGWDSSRFPDASTHHRIRAENQLALSRSVHAQLKEADRVLSETFGGP